jgi:type I restriction enzyme S subunit
MSDLPVGWTVCRVEDIFESFSGGTPSKRMANYWNGHIPWISSGEFNSDIINQGSEFITEDGLESSSAQMCRPGSVIVVVRSGILKHTLPVAIVGRKLAINQDIKCFDSGNDDLNRWLFLSLKSSAKEILSLNREGTTVQSVKYDTLKGLKLSIPPLKEQLRIVGKLEKLLSRVNAAQARLATIPRILKQFRQSVLAAAHSGRLTVDWRNINSPIEAAEARLAKMKQKRLVLVRNSSEAAKIAKTFDSVPCSPNLEVPVDWLVLKAESICDFITKGTTPNAKEMTSDGDVPFLKVQHIINNKLDFWSLPCFIVRKVHNGFLKRSKVYPRDVLMNIVGPPLNKVAIVPEEFPEWNINQALAIFRPVEGLEPEYLLLILSYERTLENVLRETRGIVGQSNISLEQCRDLTILVPPLAEQQEIVCRVEALFKTADALEARYYRAKAHVDKLTQSILARAFRGELVTQDQNDEPASALLERIREERQGKEREVVDIAAGSRRTAQPPKHSPRIYYRRAALDCYVLEALRGDHNLGRVKIEKISHLIEYHCGIDLEREPLRDAAGPNDFPSRMKVESLAKKLGWYSTSQHSDKARVLYQPGPNIADSRKPSERLLRKNRAAVNAVIAAMRPLDTRQSQIVATLYAAWNDLLHAGKTPTDAEIVDDVLNNWHPEKRRIPGEKWLQAIGWMRKMSLIPRGVGTPVKHK